MEDSSKLHMQKEREKYDELKKEIKLFVDGLPNTEIIEENNSSNKFVKSFFLSIFILKERTYAKLHRCRFPNRQTTIFGA